MDAWGWEHLTSLAHRPHRAAGGPAVLRHRRTDPRATMVECRSPRRVPPHGRSGRRETTVRAASAPPRPRGRTRARGRRAEHHPAPARARQPGHDQHLPPRHRHRGDHRHRPRQMRTDDVRHRGAPASERPIAEGAQAIAPSRHSMHARGPSRPLRRKASEPRAAPSAGGTPAGRPERAGRGGDRGAPSTRMRYLDHAFDELRATGTVCSTPTLHACRLHAPPHQLPRPLVLRAHRPPRRRSVLRDPGAPDDN